MLEKELDAEVKRLCKEMGVRRAHFGDPRRRAYGWPDLALWGPRGLIFRELKGSQTRCTREQNETGESLIEAGQDWDIWRPYDLRSGKNIPFELMQLVLNQGGQG
jgi:hypothetical protein